MNTEPKKRFFRRLNLVTIIAVYFLILVGGIVRSTGSGMGCPDWPKCFGAYTPPTHVSELPENYREIYAEKRIEKNQRLARVLEGLGLDELAREVVAGEKVQKEQEFNFTKTWIEYLNRLTGVLIGIFIICCVVSALTFFKSDPRVFYLSFGALVLVVFQGWTGSLVVSTNLLPGLITFHMVLAIALIALLIYTRFYIGKSKIVGLVSYKPAKVRRLLLFCMILFFAQVLLGTQVREAVDLIADTLGEANRWDWIENLGIVFYIHRSYSIILLLLHAFLIYRLTKSIENFSTSKYLVWSLLFLVVLEILTGVVLSYFALAYFIQPVHLLLAIVIFGVQYFLYLIISEKSVDLTE
ncbi:COX15/CtaA family protein [Reichenbachiella agariperforans]|uniref:COX15/CtaA family protein n=1 Tax=Reichenbachiella agariperforans TaxID=156994 RepID=UPI001C07FCAB|nr:COX15/CtaA family protein [Reichenbachiella agariperforans]MBU2915339.1 COX15/CtaA family protein [Reichenbachiella agariperforans]